MNGNHMKIKQTLKRMLAIMLAGLLFVGLMPIAMLTYEFMPEEIYGVNLNEIEPFNVNVPTVQTFQFFPINNAPTTVTLEGTVLRNNGYHITNTGIEWSRNSNMSGATSITRTPALHHNFDVTVRNLPQGTRIYFRAWATNSQGRGVGATLNFTTGRTLVLNAGTGANWGTTAPSGWERHSPASGNITAIRQMVAVDAWVPLFPTPANAPTDRRFSAWNPVRPPTAMPSGTTNWTSTAQWEPITRNVVLNAGTGAHWGTTAPLGWERHATDGWGNIAAIRLSNPVAIGAAMPTFPTPTSAPANQTFSAWSLARPTTMPSGTDNWSSTAQWTTITRFVILNAGTGTHWGATAPSGWIAEASTLGNITAIRSVNPVAIGAPLPTFPTPTTAPTDYSFNTWIPNRPVAMPAGTGSWSSTWTHTENTRNVILNAGAGGHWGMTPPAEWERHAPDFGNITAIRRPVVIGETMPTFPAPTGSFYGWFPVRPTTMPTGTGNWVSTAMPWGTAGGWTFTTDDPNPRLQSMSPWNVPVMQNRVPLILTNNSNTTKTATISIPATGINTALWNYTNSTRLAWGDSNRALGHNVTLNAGESFKGFACRSGYHLIVIVTWFEVPAIILNSGDFGNWGSAPPPGWEQHDSPEGGFREIRYVNPIAAGDTMPEFPIPTTIDSHAFGGWSPVRPATFPHGAEIWTSTATWTRIAHHIRLNAGTGAHWGTTAPSGWVSWGSTGGNITSIRTANPVAFGDEMPPFPIPTSVTGNRVFGAWNPPRPATMPSVSTEWSATATWGTPRSVTIALPDGVTWVAQGSLPSGWIRTNDAVIAASVAQGSAWLDNPADWPETAHIATTPQNVSIGIPARPFGNVPANDTNLVAPSRGISLTSGTLEFPAQDEGYSQPATQSTIITNIGNQETQQLTVEAPIGFQVSATQTGIFSNNITIASIADTNGTANFYVRPITGLGADTHSGNVVVRNTISQTPILPQQTREVTFTVNEAPTRSISLSEGTIHFGAATIPYTLPAAQSTIIENTGNLATQQLTVTSPTSYQVSLNQTTGFDDSITIGSIAVGGTATFWTRPNADLPAGSHSGDVTVRNTSEQNPVLLPQTRAVNFTVSSESVNNRNVILNAGSGANWGTVPPVGWERHTPASGYITAIRLAAPVEVGAAMPTFVPPTTAPMNHNFDAWSPVQPATMPSGMGDWSSTAQWTESDLPGEIRLGHVRGADTISILDVEMAYQAFRGRITLTESQFLAANVTRTGTLSILDVEMIYQAFRGRHTLS